MALSLEGNHEEAINVREKETIEIYIKTLGRPSSLYGNHPEQCALGEYDIRGSAEDSA